MGPSNNVLGRGRVPREGEILGDLSRHAVKYREVHGFALVPMIFVVVMVCK